MACGEMVAVMEPQEIEDEEHEQILERVCAIDVAKASGKVCTRVPHPSRPGARRTRVWDVDATTNAILELGEHLAGEGLGAVGMMAERRPGEPQTVMAIFPCARPFPGGVWPRVLRGADTSFPRWE